MSRTARRLGGALSLLALLALVAAGLATGGTPPAPVGPSKPGKISKVGQSNPRSATALPGAIHAVGYRLTARLAPTTGSSAATGRWDGVLVHTVGTVKAGAMPSIPGCSVTAPKQGRPGQPGSPPRASGIPHKIKCSGGAVPPFAVPGTGKHWILGWRLSFANLSSAVTGAEIRLNAPGAAGAFATNLCGSCTSGKFGRTTLTDDQASALLKGDAYVVVDTVNSPGGEISGQIVKLVPQPAHG
jgi:CHRD domain